MTQITETIITDNVKLHLITELNNNSYQNRSSRYYSKSTQKIHNNQIDKIKNIEGAHRIFSDKIIK